MIRLLPALALLVALSACEPAFAARRSYHRPVCVPVFMEGVGTVRICGPARGR